MRHGQGEEQAQRAIVSVDVHVEVIHVPETVATGLEVELQPAPQLGPRNPKVTGRGSIPLDSPDLGIRDSVVNLDHKMHRLVERFNLHRRDESLIEKAQAQTPVLQLLGIYVDHHAPMIVILTNADRQLPDSCNHRVPTSLPVQVIVLQDLTRFWIDLFNVNVIGFYILGFGPILPPAVHAPQLVRSHLDRIVPDNLPSQGTRVALAIEPVA